MFGGLWVRVVRWSCFVRVMSEGGCHCYFCFQAEDGIRVAQESRGLGDVYKRQAISAVTATELVAGCRNVRERRQVDQLIEHYAMHDLSLIHI